MPQFEKGNSGRPKGAKNKKTIEAEKAAEELGTTSLKYLQSIYADDEQPVERRMAAAVACLPYEFSKKPTELWHAGQDGGDMNFVVEVPMPIDDIEEWAKQCGTGQVIKGKTIN